MASGVEGAIDLAAVRAKLPKQRTREEKAALKAAEHAEKSAAHKAAQDLAREALKKSMNAAVEAASAWNPQDPIVVEDVMDRFACGQSMRRIAEDYEVSASMVSRCFSANAERYAQAKADRAHYLAQRMVDITEDVIKGKMDPNAARVAVDVFKWTSAKMLHKEYGDKIEVEAKVQHSLADSLKALSDSPAPQVIDVQTKEIK